jgi:DnaK suppressor protein
MATKESSSAPALPVLPGEDPWTPEEQAEVRTALEEDIARMRRAITEAEDGLADRMNEGPDGAGKDPADVGSANFERDQEMSLAANTREMLNQAELALALFDQGRYGYCEACGKPIGKLRLQAFPRATLCVACKLKEERR